MAARAQKSPFINNAPQWCKGANKMNDTSKTLLRLLPELSDEELRVLFGRLTLNMYGADTSDQMADFVITERKRREALAA
jgi:hypothetical protein